MIVSKIKKYYNKNPVLMLLLALMLVTPVIYVGASIPQTTHPLYNEITTDLKLFDYGDWDDDPATGPVYTLVTDTGVRVYNMLKVAVNVDHTEGLIGINLYICNDDNGNVGSAIQTLDMEKVGVSTFSNMIDMDGWATGYYWVKISATVSMHSVNVGTNPDYTEWLEWMAWWDALDETDQLSWYEIWKETGGGIPRQPAQYLYEDKADVYVVEDEPQRFSLKNPNKDLVFTFGITLADGTAYSGGATDQEMSFWVDVSTGVITQAALTIYKKSPVARVVFFNNIADAEFNVGGGQENDLYYAKVVLYGAAGWNGDFRSIDISIHNIDAIAGTVNVYKATKTGWSIVEDAGTLAGDLKVEVILFSGVASSMTAIFDGPTGNYRYPMTYDVAQNRWYVELNSRELVNDYYTITVEAVRAEDQAMSYLSAFSFDVHGSVALPMLPLILIMAVLGLVVVAVYLRTGGFGKKARKLKGVKRK